jgi:hypothetical protein
MGKNSGALPRPEAQAGNIQFTLTRPAEALRLAEEIRIPQDIADAQTLLDWFAARSMRQVAAVDIQKRGPGPLRRKDRMDPAIEVLVEKDP